MNLLNSKGLFRNKVFIVIFFINLICLSESEKLIQKCINSSTNRASIHINKTVVYFCTLYYAIIYSNTLSVSQELIDWSQALVRQVGGLGSRYHSWVVRPVDRRARLFDWNWLEQLTVVQWYVIPLVWVPVCVLLLYISHQRLVNITDSQGNSFVSTTLFQ